MARPLAGNQFLTGIPLELVFRVLARGKEARVPRSACFTRRVTSAMASYVFLNINSNFLAIHGERNMPPRKGNGHCQCNLLPMSNCPGHGSM